MKKLKKGRKSSAKKRTGSQSTTSVKGFLTLFDGFPNCDEWLEVKGSLGQEPTSTSSSSWLDEKLYFSFPSAKTYMTNTSQ